MRTVCVGSFLNPNRIAVIYLPLVLMFPPHSPAQASPTPAPHEDAVHAASATPDSSATPTINTTVDEVSLDLTVRTKHNKPVLDLQPSQLALSDDGSPVQLSSLRLVASASGSEHLITMVFDRLDPSPAKNARKIAEKILEAIPEKGYALAVLQVNGRLRLLQPFTQDRRLIDAAIVDATPTSPAAPTAELTKAEKDLIASIQGDSLSFDSAGRAEGKLLLSALDQSQRLLEGQHSYPSLAALQALVLSDRLLTGRKFIFYFSRGTVSNSDARDMVHSIAGLANRAGVTICAVDTGAIVNEQMDAAMRASMARSALGATYAGNVGNASGSAGASSGKVPGGTTSGALGQYVAGQSMFGFEYGEVGNDESPLTPLASGTGGIYIGTTGISKSQLNHLHDDLTTWYQASWVPPIKNYDGQFRPVDVRPLRKGLVIRSRSGYFALPPTDASGIRPFEVPLLNILAGAALPSDLAFHAGILHLGELPDGNSSELVVQVPISQLEIHEDANTHISSVHADVVAVIKDSKGTVLERFGQDFPLHETPEMFHLNSGQSIALERHFSADPGVYTLETAVMDRVANKAAAQRITFTIAPQQQGPALSDVALVQSVEPVQQDDMAFEPMRVGDGRVVPNLAPELPGDTRSVSLFFLVHPVGGSRDQPKLRMQVFRDGQMMAEMPIELKNVSGTGAAIPYLDSIRSSVFPPGEYEVKTLLSQDGRAASSSASFRVEGVIASNSPNPSLATAGSPGSDAVDSHLVSEASTANSRFVISSSANPIPPPTDAEIKDLIEGARQRALAWSDSLVNFSCFEITRHSIDSTGEGDWKLKDTLVEQMRFVDQTESRTTIFLNDVRSNVGPDQLAFTHSAGEFGAMFHLVFDPSAKADFKWKQSDFLDGQPVQVFTFRIARADSQFELGENEGYDQPVGVHGLVFIDPATHSVRRISVDADDIPPALPISACSMSVDYSWVAMQDHDFLLPVRGAVSLQQAKKRPVLNEFEFLNYHRYGSQAHVLTEHELKALSKP